MKKIVRNMVKAMMIIVCAVAVKVAVIDLWDCYLAVDTVEAVRAALAMI